MSNQAKDWQEGSYTVRVMGSLVEASKVHKDTVDGHICYKKSSAQAKCDPEDEFSLSMGVALAMDRLNKELGKGEIEVGDEVKIKGVNEVYNGYATWVSKNVHDIKEVARYAYCGNPDTDCVYEVIAIAPHSTEKRENLAYIKRIDGLFFPCYLISLAGLEKV